MEPATVEMSVEPVVAASLVDPLVEEAAALKEEADVAALILELLSDAEERALG